MSRETFVWYSVRTSLIFKEIWLPEKLADWNSAEQRQYDHLRSLAKMYGVDISVSFHQPSR